MGILPGPPFFLRLDSRNGPPFRGVEGVIRFFQTFLALADLNSVYRNNSTPVLTPCFAFPLFPFSLLLVFFYYGPSALSGLFGGVLPPYRFLSRMRPFLCVSRDHTQLFLNFSSAASLIFTFHHTNIFV